MENKYLNEAIIGNKKIIATFTSKGEMQRIYFPSKDNRQYINYFHTGVKINESDLIYLHDDINNTYKQYYDTDTNILNTEITNEFGLDMYDFIKAHENDSNAIIEELEKQAVNKYQVKEEEITSEKMRELERVVMLKVVDEKWMNHIDDMDELKNGIGLRAYGQQDPVVKYRMEGMDMFDEMIANMKVDVVKILMNIRRQNGEVKRQEAAKITGAALEAIESVDGGKKINTPEHSQTVVNEGPKVGRNDPCPCGSGKKYKNCCGRNQ